MPDLTLFDFVLVTFVILVGAAVQGAVGYGIGPLSTPLLVLIHPGFVPGPILFSVIFLSILVARRDRSAVDFQGLKKALPTRILGTLLGGAVLTIVPKEQFETLFAGLVLLAVVLSVAGTKLRPTAWTLSIGGLLSGFMGTTASIGGPAMTLVYQHLPGKLVRSTMAAFFIVATTISIGTLYFVGYFGVQELVLGVALLPGIFAGYALSRHVAAVLDRGYTRTVILGLSAVAGLVVLLRALI